MDRKQIGDLVRARREALGLSTRAAAALTDGEVAFSTWNQVETATLNYSADTLASILYALNAHVEVELRAGRWGEPIDPMRQQLLLRLASVVDRLKDEAVLSMLAQIEVYERSLGIQRDSNK
jgi:transcriptional regulator with XRE-family HTH domain